MNGLENKLKELLFDYCMGVTSDQQSGQVEELISSDKEAAEIYSRVKATLAPLDSIEPEPCPDDLVESTLSRFIDAANSSRGRLHQLPANRQMPKITFKQLRWTTFAGRFATAAIFLVAASIFLPALGYLRHHSRLQRCQVQQGSFFQGLGNYISDHDGQGPTVATAAGAPWWKVGYQGAENHSNTRKIYLLVQGGYVKLSSFVCPGSKHGRIVDINASQMRAYKDFPERSCVTYSFQINCRRIGNGQLICQKVVMADCNPLFEELPGDFSKPFKVQVDKESLKLNSSNHSFFGCRRGQNVLFGDGHVRFLRTRHDDLSGDDIFTVQGTDVYRGFEVPSYESDFFLAP
jgi:prepilin-type processing-associated H-X9-DG protein